MNESVGKLLHEFGEVGLAHVAAVHESFVESESGTEIVGSMSALRELEIIPHELFVHGVYTVLDDSLGTLAGILAAKVGHTLLGSENLHGVLAVVDMAYHRNESRDHAALLDRGTGEDGEVSVAGEVSRTADTVHHLGAEYMSGVYITEDVSFKSSIHRDKTESAYDFRMVGNLAGTHENFVAEEVDIVHEMEHGIVGESKCACRGELTFAGLHKMHYGILDYLGVHLELGNVGILTKTIEHGIRYIAHT